MDIGTLRSELSKLREGAKVRRGEAERSVAKANDYRDLGSNAQAEAEDKQAARLREDAERMENEAASVESRLNDAMRQVEELDRKQADVTARYEREMNELERQKESLTGGVGSYSVPLSTFL